MFRPPVTIRRHDTTRPGITSPHRGPRGEATSIRAVVTGAVVIVGAVMEGVVVDTDRHS